MVIQIVLQTSLIHCINARCSCAARRKDNSGSFCKPRPVCDEPEQTIKPTRLICLGPCCELVLHFADYQRSITSLGQTVCTSSNLNCSPLPRFQIILTPCIRLSLTQTTTGTPPACGIRVTPQSWCKIISQTCLSLVHILDLKRIGEVAGRSLLPCYSASRCRCNGLAVFSPWLL